MPNIPNVTIVTYICPWCCDKLLSLPFDEHLYRAHCEACILTAYSEKDGVLHSQWVTINFYLIRFDIPSEYTTGIVEIQRPYQDNCMLRLPYFPLPDSAEELMKKNTSVRDISMNLIPLLENILLVDGQIQCPVCGFRDFKQKNINGYIIFRCFHNLSIYKVPVEENQPFNMIRFTISDYYLQCDGRFKEITMYSNTVKSFKPLAIIPFEESFFGTEEKMLRKIQTYINLS